MKRFLVGASFLASLTFVAVVHADERTSPATQTEADRYFERGTRALAAKNYDEACPLLEKSLELDPGGGTLQNLAVCLEGQQKWASAYARFQELKSTSRAASPPRLERATLAEQHITTLEPILSRVVVDVATEDAAVATVKLDGKPQPRASWKDGVIVDPGAHSIEVSAPDRLPRTERVIIRKDKVANRETIRIPMLESAWKETRPTRPAGVVVAGAGVLTLGAGVVFAVLAIEKNDDGKERCRSEQCLVGSPALADANESKDGARLFANLSNVFIPLGAVALGVGGYLFFRTSSARQVGLGMSPAGMRLEGTF